MLYFVKMFEDFSNKFVITGFALFDVFSLNKKTLRNVMVFYHIIHHTLRRFKERKPQENQDVDINLSSAMVQTF